MERLITVGARTLDALTQECLALDPAEVVGFDGVRRREWTVRYGPIRYVDEQYYTYVLLRDDA